MRRGDLATVALLGSFGKPHPALVVQADLFEPTATVTVLLVSGTLVDAPLIRIQVEPSPENGLRKSSQIMIDKIMTVSREKLGKPSGHIDPDTMVQIDRALTLFLGLAR